MDLALLKRLVDSLSSQEYWDDEHFAYSQCKEALPCTYEQYMDVCEGLEALDSNPTDVSDFFEEYISLFKVDGKRFYWRLLSGQGSCYQLCTRSWLEQWHKAEVLDALVPIKVV